MNQKQVGNRIKELRSNLNLSQDELGKKIGVDRSYISKVESGQKNLTLETLNKICEALNIEVKSFFDFEKGDANMPKLNAIDLFSGAGGLTEGFLETGKYNFVAHVEWEMPMVETLRHNLVKKWGYSTQEAIKTVIQFDVQKTDELFYGSWSDETRKMYSKNNSKELATSGLDSIIGDKKVDVIIGGPPCQAYSIAGRAQDPNSMKDDYRNYLFESFVKIVDHYKPALFVFENVPGILSAKPGDRLVIERIYEAFDKIGYEIRNPKNIHKSIYCASDFEVPQDRRRVIIFGVRKDESIDLESLYSALDSLKMKGQKKTVRDAIGFLPRLLPLNEHIKEGRSNVSHYLEEGSEEINLHIPRYHSKRDIEVFREWLTNNMNSWSADDKLAYYKKITGKSSNHNKYRNIEWDKPSPTIVSHLQKDGLMFIHPDINQLRSITIREAALLQTFPMDFDFIGSNAYCFKMIGNAVPVLFAKGIANAVYNVMEAHINEEE